MIKENKYAEEFLTVREFAQLLKIHPVTAYDKWINTGKIPSFRVSERKILIKRSDIDKFINKTMICNNATQNVTKG